MKISNDTAIVSRSLIPSSSNAIQSLYRSAYTQIILLLTVTAFTAFGQDNEYVPSHLGPFEPQVRTNNPIREPFNFNSQAAPTAVDIDFDGDMDVVVADYYGGDGFTLLRNDGSPSAPAFNKAKYLANPFGYIAFPTAASITFTDIDADSDLDMLMGSIDGTLRFYKRTSPTGLAWTNQTTAWNATTKTGNPLFGIDLGDFSSPVFNDMDKDGDLDLLIGSSYLPDNKSVHYLVNDGSYNFAPATLTGLNPDLEETNMTLLDVDGDGDEDVVIGSADGKLYYFKRTGALSFEEQTGTASPFKNFFNGLHTSPTAADFDNDGDKDLVVAFDHINADLAYFENKGAGVFEEQKGFDNPFGGVSVVSESAPYFVDVDGDGDEDVVIGSSDNADPYLRYLKNENGKFTEESDNNPFSGVTVANMFVPSFVDLDGDGDDDLLATADNTDMTFIDHFKNEGGVFVRQDISSGPFADVYLQEGRGDFADLDRDGDFDFIGTDRRWESGNYAYYIRYFENTGTTTSAVFTERTGSANPLDNLLETFELFPRFFDIDHDGDLDALIGESGNTVENQDGNEFHFYENISTTNAPVFRYRGNLIEQGLNPYDPAPSFTDVDGDGDLDVFFGTASGELVLCKNVNPPAIVSLNTSEVSVAPGTRVIIDPLLSLNDADSDSVVRAEVTIDSFTPGQEELDYTTVAGIEGNFNASTGVLNFFGKAPLADYQSLLRTVALTYNAAAPSSGRSKNPSGSNATVQRTVSISVRDADYTISPAVSRGINFVSSAPPVFSDHIVNILAGGSTSIDLSTLVTDSNGDADLSTLSISTAMANGTITLTGSILTINFSGVKFSGQESLTLNVCDADGLCDAATVVVNVSNSAPVFSPVSRTLNSGSVLTVDLTTLITDLENNADLSTLTISQLPGSGAVASIDANNNLIVNYSQVAFAGADNLQINVCDLVGACSTGIIAVDVTNSAPVFNSTVATVPYHGAVNVDLSTLFSDAESNLNTFTLAIISTTLPGSSATLTGTTLQLNYASVNAAGEDKIRIRICDIVGACAEGVITVTIQNAPPVIQHETVSTRQGSSQMVNLLDVTSDADDNLDITTFSIVQQPSSGAKAEIEFISATEVRLTIDYSGITFAGNDQLVIRACDQAGACSENLVSVEVFSEIEVYNAVAPKSAGDNKYLRILNLPHDNKVTIFNRWGDVVYHVQHYDNDAIRFEGIGDNGNALSTGTYFYKIEYTEQSAPQKTISGYLSLKQ